MYKSTGDKPKDRALELEQRMRTILGERRNALNEFEAYLDTWTEALEKTEDSREFAQVFVVERALEQIKDATSTHDGGTSGMYVRMAKRAALDLLAAVRD